MRNANSKTTVFVVAALAHSIPYHCTFNLRLLVYLNRSTPWRCTRCVWISYGRTPVPMRGGTGERDWTWRRRKHAKIFFIF